MGIKDFDVLSADNAKYTSNEFTTEALEAIASFIEDGVLQELRGSPGFALMIDETCDISVTKQLILFYRYLSKVRSLCCEV
jgi:hypothetical protein